MWEERGIVRGVVKRDLDLGLLCFGGPKRADLVSKMVMLCLWFEVF